MMWLKYDVVKTVEYKEGCVYRTAVVASVWLPAGNEQAKLDSLVDFEDCRLQATMDAPFFGKEPPK